MAHGMQARQLCDDFLFCEALTADFDSHCELGLMGPRTNYPNYRGIAVFSSGVLLGEMRGQSDINFQWFYPKKDKK